jgi:hypothetical protein
MHGGKIIIIFHSHSFILSAKNTIGLVTFCEAKDIYEIDGFFFHSSLLYFRAFQLIVRQRRCIFAIRELNVREAAVGKKKQNHLTRFSFCWIRVCFSCVVRRFFFAV